MAAQASPADEALARGRTLLQAGQLEEAQQAFGAATLAEPKNAEAHLRLAGVLIARNRFGDAVREYHEVIGLDRRNAKAFIGLGIAYLHGGDVELARAALTEARRLEPQRAAQIDPVLASLGAPDPRRPAPVFPGGQ